MTLIEVEFFGGPRDGSILSVPEEEYQPGRNVWIVDPERPHIRYTYAVDWTVLQGKFVAHYMGPIEKPVFQCHGGSWDGQILSVEWGHVRLGAVLHFPRLNPNYENGVTPTLEEVYVFARLPTPVRHGILRFERRH